MPKPLFRWTVGSCLQQGLDILAESIKKTTEVLGIERFDWLICHNRLKPEDLDFIQKAIGDRPIALFEQHWSSCPVDDVEQSPRRSDGSYEWNGNNCGGTMWKVCPARMRIESHEIVMDNDIVLLRKFPEIEAFLSTNNMPLVLEEPIRFYGRYDALFGAGGPFLNSGFMGFPPGYDYASAIRRTWESNGRFTNLSQADEQGLLTYTLSRLPSHRIKASQMKEVLARDFKARIDCTEEAIHFVQSNKIPSHRAWIDYKKIMRHGN